MTEIRILEILAENDVYPTDKRIAAMKQAVNEAIEECINIQIGLGSVDYGQDVLLKHLKERNRKRMFNLKVK